MQKIAMIGFGEAGSAFASSIQRPPNMCIVTFDRKTQEAQTRGEILDRASACGVDVAETLSDALSDATAIFSLVTADQALAVAEAARKFIDPSTLYFDCNSCSPQNKMKAAELIDARGALYVDVAVMAPVHPKKHHVPLLVSGVHAQRAVEFLQQLDMRPSIAGSAIGQASSIKMIRSIMIKGLEALTAEAMLTAKRAGVTEQVIASLQASDPGFDWEKRSAYNLERMMVHGKRRAAEMREVAQTVHEFGIDERLASAIANWQDAIGDLHLKPESDLLEARAEQILGAMELTGEGASGECDLT